MSPKSDPDQQITRLLKRWSDGESEARDALLPLVYERLRALAARHFRSERPGHTLQPTALVNEAFLRLSNHPVDLESQGQFYALAARTMRNLLVDHARSRGRHKRGGDRLQVTLTSADPATPAPSTDLLDLDEALTELEARSPRIAAAMELTYFGGLDQDAAAHHLDVSRRTLNRDLRLGRAWLHDRLADRPGQP